MHGEEDHRRHQGEEERQPGGVRRPEMETEEGEREEEQGEDRVDPELASLRPEPVAAASAEGPRVEEDEEPQSEAVEEHREGGVGDDLKREVGQQAGVGEDDDRPGPSPGRQRAGVDPPELALVDDGGDRGLPSGQGGAQPEVVRRLLEKVLAQVAPLVGVQEDIAELGPLRARQPPLGERPAGDDGVAEAAREDGVDQRDQGGRHREDRELRVPPADRHDQLRLSRRPGVDGLDGDGVRLQTGPPSHGAEVLPVADVDQVARRPEVELVELAAVPPHPVDVGEGEAAQGGRQAPRQFLRLGSGCARGRAPRQAIHRRSGRAVDLGEQALVGRDLAAEVVVDAGGEPAQVVVDQTMETVEVPAAPQPEGEERGEAVEGGPEPDEIEPGEMLPGVHRAELQEGPAEQEETDQGDEGDERHPRQGQALGAEAARSHQPADQPGAQALVRLGARHREPQGIDEEIVAGAGDVDPLDPGGGLPSEEGAGRAPATAATAATAATPEPGEARQADLAVLLFEQDVAAPVRHDHIVEGVARQDGRDERP